MTYFYSAFFVLVTLLPWMAVCTIGAIITDIIWPKIAERRKTKCASSRR